MALWGAGSAYAFTAARDGTRLEIAAGPGETNALMAADDGIDVVISDGTGYPPQGPVPAGCAVDEAGLACPRSSLQSVRIDAGDGNDSVTAQTSLAAVLVGGRGDDTLAAGSASDVLDGGDGSDAIDAGDGDNVVAGGAGDDSLVAGSGNDRIATGTGTRDAIDAGDGSDILTVSDGSALAGAGADRVTIDDSATVDAGAGDDEVTSTAPGAVDVAGADGRDTIRTGSGADTVDGGAGDDDLEAGAGADKIDGADGNDVVTAGPGDDVVTFSVGADAYSGGAGSDVLDAGLRDGVVAISLDNLPNDGSDGDGANARDDFEHVVGGEGDDTLLAGAPPAILDGGGGNDLLRGGPAADSLDGHAGDDSLDGGLGADIERGGDGFDTADYGSRQASVEVRRANGQAHAGQAAEADILEPDIERVLTGSGADAVAVDPAVAQTIATGSGDDAIDAHDDNGLTDVLDCGPGNDTVHVDGSDVYGEDCETVYEDAALLRSPGTPSARVSLGTGMLRVGRQGTITAVLACDLSAAGGCAGAVTLTDPRTKQRLSRAKYTSLPGQSHGVRVRVPARWMRILRRRNPTRARMSLTATARARVLPGPTFTLRTPIVVTYRAVRR